ncbi:MAG: hypothetical protein V7K27_35580 [Nostoc sp.]|uniref:hypothetical protein n=1 Tax=Nostoc sp. TaxID=1180 RepID=UPI002FFD51A0
MNNLFLDPHQIYDLVVNFRSGGSESPTERLVNSEFWILHSSSTRAIFAIQNLNWYQRSQVQVKLIQQPYLHRVELIISH